MRFDLTVTLGNLVTFGALCGAIWRIESFVRRIDRFLIEHEMLVMDYCDRNNISLGKLPTRSKHV